MEPFMKRGEVFPGVLGPVSGGEECPKREYQTAWRGSLGGVFGVFVSIGISSITEFEGFGRRGLWREKKRYN
jgi:hypothetical protein